MALGVFNSIFKRTDLLLHIGHNYKLNIQIVNLNIKSLILIKSYYTIRGGVLTFIFFTINLPKKKLSY